jgi:hypothetical protein
VKRRSLDGQAPPTDEKPRGWFGVEVGPDEVIHVVVPPFAEKTMTLVKSIRCSTSRRCLVGGVYLAENKGLYAIAHRPIGPGQIEHTEGAPVANVGDEQWLRFPCRCDRKRTVTGRALRDGLKGAGDIRV